MIFDIETDGFDPTKIHVMSWKSEVNQDGSCTLESTDDYDRMRGILMSADTLIGHNIIRYDLPVVQKILGFRPAKHQKVIDTLPLSWYLNHDRGKHSLESYGDDYGVPKPIIEDWDSLTYEEYRHRCEEDVKINDRLWRELSYKLGRLYKDTEGRDKCLRYLMFKMECAREQEALGWRIDIDKARTHLQQLEEMKAEKVEQLKNAMPEQIVYGDRKRPAQWEKKDGSLTSRAHDWMALMDEMCLPYSTQNVKVELRRVEANPNSITQVKDWLFGLGWEPAVYIDSNRGANGHSNFNKKAQEILEAQKLDQDRGNHKVPQIRVNNELCESVLKLKDREPAVEVLEGLTIINHRLGIFKSFVDSERGGYVKASVAGFTNTLRFRHARPLVNLPAVDKPWGAEIRGCLIAPDGYTLCGADMVSLEDTTKRHFMFKYDPEYVEEMSRDGFDPHLDLAKHSGRIKQEDIDMYQAGELDLKSLRKKFKVVNYAATYGVGTRSLAVQMGSNEAEASFMLDAFWQRNWSIKEVADSCKVREVNGGSWILNPVSGIYHSLRYEKDRFSTLNQSTGVYCFDTWVAGCRSRGIVTIGQFHDEIIALVKEGEEQRIEHIMKTSIEKTNERVQLNVPLDIDYSFGKNYSEIH